MKTFKFKPFLGLSPSNTETFEALLRVRFRQYMRMLRHCDVDERGYCLGVCDGMVSALYDVSSPMAWQYNKALSKLRKLTVS